MADESPCGIAEGWRGPRVGRAGAQSNAVERRRAFEQEVGLALAERRHDGQVPVRAVAGHIELTHALTRVAFARVHEREETLGADVTGARAALRLAVRIQALPPLQREIGVAVFERVAV